jgi:hypothetical protein
MAFLVGCPRFLPVHIVNCVQTLKAGETCTVADCCEDNDQCSVFFDSENTNVCDVLSQVKVVHTTVCANDPCTVVDCCAERFCDISYGLDPTICTPGAVRVFRQKFIHEDAIGSHAFASPLLRLKRTCVQPMAFLSGVQSSYRLAL